MSPEKDWGPGPVERQLGSVESERKFGSSVEAAAVAIDLRDLQVDQGQVIS